MPEDASSDRSTGMGSFHPPIFEIDTFDQFTDHYWFLGRPLWKMNLEYRHSKDFMQLMKFAAHKLYFPHDSNCKWDGLVALFLCRYGLSPTGDLAKKTCCKSHGNTCWSECR